MTTVNSAFVRVAADARPGLGRYSWAEHGLLRFLADRLNKKSNDPVCWFSQGRLAKEFDCSRDYIGRLLRSLQDQGYLEVEHREGRSNVYRLLDRNGDLDAHYQRSCGGDVGVPVFGPCGVAPSDGVCTGPVVSDRGVSH